MNLRILAALMTSIVSSSAWTAGNYPQMIQTIIDDQVKACEANNKGQLTVTNQAIQSFHLNKDKIKDFLVDESGFECTTSAAMRGGSEAIKIKIYLSKNKKKWKMAWEKEVLAYQFDRMKSHLIVEMRDSKDPLKVVKKALKIDATRVTY